jgi:hypothetical protein
VGAPTVREGEGNGHSAGLSQASQTSLVSSAGTAVKRTLSSASG